MPLLCDFPSASGYLSSCLLLEATSVCQSVTFSFQLPIYFTCFFRGKVCSQHCLLFLKSISVWMCSVFCSWDFKWAHASKLFVGMGLHSFSRDCIMLWCKTLRHCILWCTKRWCPFSAFYSRPIGYHSDKLCLLPCAHCWHVEKLRKVE